jgi:hypothetical protein
MKKSSLYYVFAVGLALGFYQAPAEAISIGFQPIAQTINGGDAFAVDVIVSGLSSASEIVSAFDLDVTYNPSILTATGVIFNTLLGDPALFEADNGTVLTSGRIDFWALSFLSDAELVLLQPDSFSLATFSFQALGAGTTALLFDPNTPPGIDVKGLLAGRLDLDVSAASVTVAAQPNSVPEPSTIWMCLLGLGGLMIQIRHTQYNPVNECKN